MVTHVIILHTKETTLTQTQLTAAPPGLKYCPPSTDNQQPLKKWNTYSRLKYTDPEDHGVSQLTKWNEEQNVARNGNALFPVVHCWIMFMDLKGLKGLPGANSFFAPVSWYDVWVNRTHIA